MHGVRPRARRFAAGKELALTRSRLVRGYRLALAGPWPCMTREIELAATGREPFKWLYRIYKVA